MKELEEVNCEIRNVIEIQHFVTNYLSNVEGDVNGSLNDSQIFDGINDVYGGFLNDATYAWLSYGCHLIVFSTKTGENYSSWTFRGKITCVCQFPAQCGESPLLLVGLDNEATRTKDSMGLICIFDCSTSRVLRAIRMPAGVEQVCIVSGGAEWEDFNNKRPDNILMQMDGIACVVLCNLHHLMVDLQRSTWEVSDSFVLMDESSPAEIEFITTKNSFHTNQLNKSKHMTCNLLNNRIEKHIGFNREEFESNAILEEKLTTSIISSTKIGCLISGCLGRVIIWQNDGSVGWISSPVDETMIITHLALLEPTDDPRSFYYLWVVFQDDSYKVPPLLRMYALLFERKYCDKRTNLYFNLEAEPSLKFEFTLDTTDRVVSLSTIEREMNPDQTESEFRQGEESLLLISTTNKTLLFDLNQWYKEQMPQIISECKNPNSILASYNTKRRPHNMTSNKIISCTYVPRTLQEFPNNLSLSEEVFYPNSLSLEWIELSLTKLTFWFSRGVQTELLREIALTGPIILTQPSEMFHKCLSVGLVPYNTEVSFSSDQNVQRDMLLSLCLEQRWTTFLIRCANEWSDGSAAYMYPNFLKWGIQRTSSIKMIADRLCVPLFDQSGNSIGESEVKTLRFCYQQLECLSNVVAKLPLETSSLIKQRKALKRISIYFEVLLWFYDVGLLPECQNLEVRPLPVSLSLKIPYPFEKLYKLYKEKRESIENNKQADENEGALFIDELIARECPALNLQWEKEAGDTISNGHYPPPSLQSLLRSYLTDCDQTALNEIECKHQIIIYLLMDLAMLLQGSYPGVDQLIKYPSSFKMSPSLIKLTQAFWLLDHEDYHGFLDMMTCQLVCDSDIKDWHHKLVLRTLVRNNQHKLALMYLRIKKPPLSSIQEQSMLICLSVEHGSVQSTFHHRPQSYYAQLLTCFFQACKTYNKLSDILHLALDSEEEELFVKFLEDTKSKDIQLLYYLQRCRYVEANCGNLFTCLNTTASKNLHTDILNAYNATLPDVVKQFSVNVGKTNLDVGLEMRCLKPMSHHKNSQKITNIYETVIKKAKETYPREEKSLIPFVTAPCTSLKLNDDRININCVVSPRIVQKNRKRTLDQMMDHEEDSGIRTPDRTKRRKLLDDGEAALTAAFSTPLVKRKVSSSRDTAMETPHSILKIRQLIRNSTTPPNGNLEEDITDNVTSDKKQKINRQIRFSISQCRKNNIQDETNNEESNSKLSVSEESEEVFFSPTMGEKSLNESAVLSDTSYTCKNLYTARPRPSLRRTYLQTSADSVNESLLKCCRTKNVDSLPNSFETHFRLASETSQPMPQRYTSMFSSSVQSSAVLSPDSSFEMDISLNKSIDIAAQSSLKFSEQQNKYNAVNSLLVPKGDSRTEEQCQNAERINVSTEKNTELDVSSAEKQGIDESTDILNPQFHECNKSMEDVQNVHRNGNLLKAKTLEVDNEKIINREGEFKYVFNIAEDNSNVFQSAEHCSMSINKTSQSESRHDMNEYENLKNGEDFDITEDESSNSGDEMVLTDEKSNKKNNSSLAIQMHVDNMYDVSNITEDESDSSVGDEPKQSSITFSNRQGNVDNNFKFSIKERDIPECKTIEKSIHLDNNNFNYKETTETPVCEVSQSASVNNSNLTTEFVDSGQSYTLGITRSRRASSMVKETNTPPLNSPSKISGKTTRPRRGSSLIKEVFIESVDKADGVRQPALSTLEESSSISSPKKNRGKRASSEDIKNEEAKMPLRRSTRRATSVQKELSEDENQKTLVETKRTKSKQSSMNERNASLRSIKESRIHEKKEEETSSLKLTKKRASSVSKEPLNVIRSRRYSNSVLKENNSEDLKSQEATKGQHLIELALNSPAANTRSRKLSIQSVPEELEEVLSMPSKERIPKSKSTKQMVQNSRQRRAASAEPYQVGVKRTRSTRSTDILKEVIIEEEITEIKNQVNQEASSVKKMSTKRKHISLNTTSQETDETIPRSRRNRKLRKQEGSDHFSFSQPEKPDDFPTDQRVIGEIPKYVFSPPHTRSKANAPDYRSRMRNFNLVLKEDKTEKEQKEEGQQVLKKNSDFEIGRYIGVNRSRCRKKFVLPKRSRNTSN